MRNYKIFIDFFDVYEDLIKFDLYEFHSPFTIIFIEALDPDDACNIAALRLMRMIMKQDASIQTRIICRKIRKHIRIDKVYAL
jgi:hypothetical protein